MTKFMDFIGESLRVWGILVGMGVAGYILNVLFL